MIVIDKMHRLKSRDKKFIPRVLISIVNDMADKTKSPKPQTVKNSSTNSISNPSKSTMSKSVAENASSGKISVNESNLSVSDCDCPNFQIETVSSGTERSKDVTIQKLTLCSRSAHVEQNELSIFTKRWLQHPVLFQYYLDCLQEYKIIQEQYLNADKSANSRINHTIQTAAVFATLRYAKEHDIKLYFDLPENTEQVKELKKLGLYK